MNILGFSFTKIAAQRTEGVQETSALDTNIKFTTVEKDSAPLLKQDALVKIGFSFELTYATNQAKKREQYASVICEGVILVSCLEKEAQEVLKFWKKKELPANFKVPLFNLIIRKCSIKTLALQDDLNLPTNVKIPQVDTQTMTTENS
jgi:hypothetical protein